MIDRECENEDSVEITFQILTISNIGIYHEKNVQTQNFSMGGVVNVVIKFCVWTVFE